LQYLQRNFCEKKGISDQKEMIYKSSGFKIDFVGQYVGFRKFAARSGSGRLRPAERRTMLPAVLPMKNRRILC
jgi:hypothetical protein